MRLIVIAAFILGQTEWSKAFGGKCTKVSLVKTILDYAQKGHLLSATSPDGDIVGVIFFTPNKAEGMVSVEHFVGAHNRNTIRGALTYWAQHYPECTVYAKRRGKTVHYNPEHFLKKLLTH